MRKFVLYAATTAIAVSVLAPISAQAAVKVIMGNGKTVSSGSGCLNGQLQNGQNLNLDQLIQDMMNSNGSCTDSSLPQINWPGLGNAGENCPEQSQPESSKPSQNRPESSRPEQNRPENGKPEQNQPENGKPEQDNTTSASYVQQVIDLVNEERAKAGLSPLTESSSVAQAADIRAKEIATSFSHTRPDGSSFSTALQQSGASYRGAGENIAYGQRTPEAVMNSWMNSQGHRANILNENYTTIGVGYYEDANGTDYWTQLFTY